jgi:hypothetical protein
MLSVARHIVPAQRASARSRHAATPADRRWIRAKGPSTLYLEAKGTEGAGTSVLVTPGEVDHARKHPGQCMLGITSGIRLQADGSIDEASGDLRVHDWNPDVGTLEPTGYEWSPPRL